MNQTVTTLCFGELCPEVGMCHYRVGLREYQQALTDGLGYVRMLRRSGVTNIRCVGRGLGAFVAHQVANTTRLPAVLIEPDLQPFSDPTNMLLKLQLFLTYDAMQEAEKACVAPTAPRQIFYDRNKSMIWTKWMDQERGIYAVSI